MADPKINASKVLGAFKSFSGGSDEDAAPIWLVKVDNAVWVATGYFAFRPASIAFIVLQNLWEQCNLKFDAPMRVAVGLSVTKMDGEVPDIERLFPNAKTLGDIEPKPLADGVLMHEAIEDQPTEMWRREDGSWAFFNSEYAHLVRRLTNIEAWKQGPDPLGVVVGYEEGERAALLNPIRVTENKVLIRDPDLPMTLFDSQP